MANIKSQIKRIKTNAARTERNRATKSELRTWIRKVRTAVEAGDAAALVYTGSGWRDGADEPFVGPAGRLFDRALDAADIDRETTYVTNAVKHFKHEPRGKRRLHKTPNAGEVQACRWWLDSERRLIKPQVVLALGATAGLALLGRKPAVMQERGAVVVLDRRTVLLSADGIDITNDLIARIDAELGDGADQPAAPPAPAPAPQPEDAGN